MHKHSVFAGAIMLLVGAIMVQSMRGNAVASAPESLTQVSPFELMQDARDLPAQRIEYPY
jgi:hypothetical protein